MDFFKAIEARHSYRGAFEDTVVPDADLIKIVDAGIRAPSGCNAQTTSFMVVTNPALRGKIAEIFDHSEILTTAPAIIVAYTKKVTFDFGLDFELEDYGAAIENILLAATAMGYASLWLDGGTRLGGTDTALAKLLDIPVDMQVRTVMPIGVPKNPGMQAPRKAFDERVVWKR
ncbi:MAG: nitroreductase family protein [Defluviitaleaceae bacterium]|nr:nitroreductase family protein [Defluviitaleaceae bacterium]